MLCRARSAALAVSMLILLGPIAAASAQEEEQAAPKAPVARYRLEVGEMKCAFCAYGLERKLRTLQGVADVEIELGEALAVVELEPGATLSPDAVAAVVEEAGFSLGGMRMRSRGLVRGSGDRLTFVLGRERFGLRAGRGFAALRELVGEGTRDVVLTVDVEVGSSEEAPTTLTVLEAVPAEPEPPADEDDGG